MEAKMFTCPRCRVEIHFKTHMHKPGHLLSVHLNQCMGYLDNTNVSVHIQTEEGRQGNETQASFPRLKDEEIRFVEGEELSVDAGDSLEKLIEVSLRRSEQSPSSFRGVHPEQDPSTLNYGVEVCLRTEEISLDVRQRKIYCTDLDT